MAKFTIKSKKTSKKALDELSKKEQQIDGDKVKGGAFERMNIPTTSGVPPKKG